MILASRYKQIYKSNSMLFEHKNLPIIINSKNRFIGYDVYDDNYQNVDCITKKELDSLLNSTNINDYYSISKKLNMGLYYGYNNKFYLSLDASGGIIDLQSKDIICQDEKDINNNYVYDEFDNILIEGNKVIILKSVCDKKDRCKSHVSVLDIDEDIIPLKLYKCNFIIKPFFSKYQLYYKNYKVICTNAGFVFVPKGNIILKNCSNYSYIIKYSNKIYFLQEEILSEIFFDDFKEMPIMECDTEERNISSYIYANKYIIENKHLCEIDFDNLKIKTLSTDVNYMIAGDYNSLIVYDKEKVLVRF